MDFCVWSALDKNTFYTNTVFSITAASFLKKQYCDLDIEETSSGHSNNEPSLSKLPSQKWFPVLRRVTLAMGNGV